MVIRENPQLCVNSQALRETPFAEVAFSQAPYGIIEHCIQQGNLTADFVTTVGRLKELRWHHEIIAEPGR